MPDVYQGPNKNQSRCRRTKALLLLPWLYESYRDSDGRTRQQYLLPLDLDDLPSWKDREVMCKVLNAMVKNGPRLPLDDTLVNQKANIVYHQLLDKGLLGDVRAGLRRITAAKTT